MGALGLDVLSAMQARVSQGCTIIQRYPETGGLCQDCGDLKSLWYCAVLPTDNPTLGKPVVSVEGKWFYVVEEWNVACKCAASTRSDIILSGSGVPAHEREWSLSYIKGIHGRDDAYRVGMDILASLPMPYGFYLFWGGNGAGKSGILKSLVNSCTASGIPARYVQAGEVLEAFRSTYNGSQSDEADIRRQFLSYRLLAIDEIDVVSSTEWAVSTLRMLVDACYERRSLMATVFATNAAPGTVWPYLASRLDDGETVHVTGQSLRGVNAPRPSTIDTDDLAKKVFGL